MVPMVTQAQTLFEDTQIKAAMMYKLTKFIDWPHKRQHIVLCTMGEDHHRSDITVADALRHILDKKSSPMTLKSDIDPGEVGQCNIVFISADKIKEIKDILTVTRKHYVVTISDIKSFIRRGGIFGFYKDADCRVQLELSYDNLKKAGINLDTSLLEVIRVEGKP